MGAVIKQRRRHAIGCCRSRHAKRRDVLGGSEAEVRDIGPLGALHRPGEIWRTMVGSVIESSATRRNALLSTMDNVASPSNGRKRRSPPAATGSRAGTMQR